MSDELSEMTKPGVSLQTKIITTRKDLEKAFKSVGLRMRDIVIVHASLAKLGYLVNGPHDVIEAVMKIIGTQGTMLVSANTSQNTDPSEWTSPPVPKSWIPLIRKEMRPFDPATTLVRGRGLLPLSFMMYPGVYRSPHPVKSIAARGKDARAMTKYHPFDESEGVGSPLHRLYLKKGCTLLVGVDLTQCSAIHLAEFLADVAYLYPPKFKCLITGRDGKNQFRAMKKYPITSKYFNKLEKGFKKKGILKTVHWHGCPITLVRVFPAVNQVVELLKQDEEYLLRP